MIVVMGLRALTAAAVAAVTSVATNSGSTQPQSDNFVIFGQHLNGLPTRQLVLRSIAVSVVDSASTVDGASTDWSGQAPPPVENNPRPKPVRSAGTRSRRALRHQAPHQATGCGRNPAPCGPAVRRCPISTVAADHHDAERYPGHHHPRQRQHHRGQRQRQCAGGVYLRVIDGVKPVVPIENVRASR
jgi:hypothetical protein